VRGRDVEKPVALLRVLAVADAMEFKHLPVMGGLYDQHPDFIEGVMLLLQARGRYEREKQKKQEDQSKRRNTPQARSRAHR
jgi:hypothetical protein